MTAVARAVAALLAAVDFDKHTAPFADDHYAQDQMSRPNRHEWRVWRFSLGDSL